MNKVYDIITDEIIKKLEEGTVPWRKPWSTGGLPKNLVSGKEYRGMNILLLGSQGYANPYWVSFKQCGELGGHVRKGERGSIAVFWATNKYKAQNDDGDEEIRSGFILRYYKVFNVDQCDGISHKRLTELQEVDRREFNPIEECEVIVENMPNRPAIGNGVSQAYYRPSDDTVNMPPKDTFRGDEEYYSTLFHELTHSTGHKSRLGRHGTDCPHHFSRIEYSKEELIAEMGATFLSGHAGIVDQVIDNSAAYIQSWLQALKNDHSLVVSAASKAQKATDYILGVTWK